MEASQQSAPAQTSDSAPASKIPVVHLGNSAPMHQIEGENGARIGVPHPVIKQSVTRVEFGPHVLDDEHTKLTLSTDNDRVLSMIARSLPDEHKRYAVALAELEQIMGVHSGISKPAWVDSDDHELAEVIGKHFGCSVGEPTMLLTNGGRDNVHARNYSTAAQPAAANYMALTANTTAPAATDTTLTGEITTAGGGLLRAQATYAHTAGTNTSTLTKTFTANGSDSLPVTIAQIGVFNASSAGTLEFHTALSSTATLSTSGDNVTITESITAG